MTKITNNPTELFDSIQHGFSQVAFSKPGKLIFISGQVARDKDNKLVGKNDLKTQAQKAISNLKIAIESIGGSMENILMLRIYIVEYQQEHAPIISSILKENFDPNNPPASTWINVKGLANEEFMIEVEAQAVMPE